MPNSLIKGIALTLGGGLAVGLGIKMAQTSTPPPPARGSLDRADILGRIEGLEDRVADVESSHATLPAVVDPRQTPIPSVDELEQRVQAQWSEVKALRAAVQCAAGKHDARLDDLSRAVGNLEARLPELVDQNIKPRVEELQESLRGAMQETANRAMQSFVDRVQVNVAGRITAIEGDLFRQSNTIDSLRGDSVKTGQTLQGLLAAIENLADKINREGKASAETARTAIRSGMGAERRTVAGLAGPFKSEPGGAAGVRTARETFPIPAPIPAPSDVSRIGSLAEKSPGNWRRRAATAGGLALVAIAGGSDLSGFLHRTKSAQPAKHNAPQHNITVRATQGSEDSLESKKLTDHTSLVNRARAFSKKGKFENAENIYRSILKSDPSASQVKRLLASALYRQNKIEESVSVLATISDSTQSGSEATEPDR